MSKYVSVGQIFLTVLGLDLRFVYKNTCKLDTFLHAPFLSKEYVMHVLKKVLNYRVSVQID